MDATAFISGRGGTLDAGQNLSLRTPSTISASLTPRTGSAGVPSTLE